MSDPIIQEIKSRVGVDPVSISMIDYQITKSVRRSRLAAHNSDVRNMRV